MPSGYDPAGGLRFSDNVMLIHNRAVAGGKSLSSALRHASQSDRTRRTLPTFRPARLPS
jgi:hypothetical protein